MVREASLPLLSVWGNAPFRMEEPQGIVDWSKGRLVRHESNRYEAVSCGGEGV